MALKFPYGLADFRRLILENYLYIDRTDRIPLVENTGNHLIFLRPRRFGKSLWLSVLENYYDLARADEFDTLFGHLAIGNNPTPNRNRYFILKWDFSNVNAQGSAEDLTRKLYNYLNTEMKIFARRYEAYLSHPIEIQTDDAMMSFYSLVATVKASGYPLYLLIDEYDNFANEVLMSRQRGARERYEALLYGEGTLRSLFKNLKSAAGGMGLERVFITGTSPIAMSDVSNAYNIAKDLSLHRKFNDLCGFHADEIEVWLQQISAACNLPPAAADDALDIMRTYYNGYRFNPKVQAWVYNPTMVIYFLEYLRDDCEYPQEILDKNLATDRLKLEYVSTLPNGAEILTQVLDNQQLLAIPKLSERFGVADVLNPSQDNAETASLLYYLGMLTFDTHTSFMGEVALQIPNLTAKILYLERIRHLCFPTGKEANEIRRLVKPLYLQADIQPLCDFIERERLQLFDNRDYLAANELTIKTVFLMLLATDAVPYILDSETELGRGYADLTLIVRPDMRQNTPLLDILLEFKYVSLKSVGLSAEQVRAKSAEELEKLPAVQQQRMAAEAQLTRYRHVLEKKYAGALRLRCFSVVAVGFERVLGQVVVG